MSLPTAAARPAQQPTQRPPLVAHDWLTGMRGGEKVLEAILEVLGDAEIYTLFHFPGSVSAAIEARPIHTSSLQRAPFLRQRYRHYLPLFPRAIESFELPATHLVVSSSHAVAKGIIKPPGARHVCYCHTPMRYAWDQAEVYFPHDRGLIRILRGLVLRRLRRWDRATSGRVDRYLANSRFVAQRIRRYYGRHAEVLAPPVDVDFFTPAPAPSTELTPEPAYALAVTALAPYKRLDLAIRACEHLRIPLRIVGTGPERHRLQALAGEMTRFEGWVDGERLRELYRGARFALQPGVEDFGIAPVEALASGRPVVAAGEGGVLDIVEPGVHGWFHRPGDLDDLIRVLDKIQGVEFNPLNLRQRAEEFSRERFVQRLRRLLTEESA
jgi:glycosyltransferase involved in cell wall biosynthesis